MVVLYFRAGVVVCKPVQNCNFVPEGGIKPRSTRENSHERGMCRHIGRIWY